MNGRELTRKAQAIRSGLKVLFMTGYSRNAIVHQGRLDPDVELIQKPITQDQLANRIRAVLDGMPGSRTCGAASSHCEQVSHGRIPILQISMD
jgi:DNA-binding response OmpR family regulator